MTADKALTPPARKDSTQKITPAKKAAAKKAPTKKVLGKKAAAKKAAAKKAPGKKAAAKKAAKKAPTKKVLGKKTTGKQGGPRVPDAGPADGYGPHAARAVPPRAALAAGPTDPALILGITGPVTPKTARAAWRAYAAAHHPDRGGNAATFSRGRNAYQQLLDNLGRH